MATANQNQQQAALREIRSDPASFRRAIKIDCDGEPKRFSDVCEHWQGQDFKALDSAWQKVCGQDVETKYQRAWLERPRGHSKSTDIAIQVLWALFASSRKLSGVVAASDKDQASILRNAIDTLLRLNPWLGKIISVQRERITNPEIGSECQILASDVASSYGLLPDFCVLDELSHWKNAGLWESLFSSAAKKKNCLLTVISNAGFGDSWQWVLREKIRTDPRWYFNALLGPKASWISAEILDEQRRLLPEKAYQRLWENRWSSGMGDALKDADIKASITLKGPSFKKEPGWEYVGGLDLGISRDASAFVVVGKNVGYVRERKLNSRVKLSSIEKDMVDLGMLQFPKHPEPEVEKTFHPGDDSLKVVSVDLWTPKRGERVDLQSVMDRVVELDRIFNFASLGLDPWQSEFLHQQLRRKRIPADLVFYTGPEMDFMAKYLLGAFQDRTISLFQHDDLLADLRSLRVKEMSGGRLKLESPRSSKSDGESGTVHGDSAAALSLALLKSRRLTNKNRVDRARNLVLYP